MCNLQPNPNLGAVPTLSRLDTAYSAFEVNLAQFPFAVPSTKLRKRLTQITVSGTFRNQRTGTNEPYTWTVKGASGLPGPLAQDVFYEILQRWSDDYSAGTQILYGSVRAFLRAIGYAHHPGENDARGFIEAIKQLVGLQIDCENCFFDPISNTRCSLTWHPFSRATHPANTRDYDKFSPAFFVELDPFFASILRSNGRWVLPFPRERYYHLSPLQKRFAVYLAKMLKVQAVHDLSLDDVLQLGPITDKLRRKARATATSVFTTLCQTKIIPYFKSFRTYPANGVERFQFLSSHVRRNPKVPLTPDEEYNLERIAKAVDSDSATKYRPLWLKYVRRYGHNGVDRALGILRDTAESYCRQRKPFHTGKVLRTIFERDLTLTSSKNSPKDVPAPLPTGGDHAVPTSFQPKAQSQEQQYQAQAAEAERERQEAEERSKVSAYLGSLTAEARRQLDQEVLNALPAFLQSKAWESRASSPIFQASLHTHVQKLLEQQKQPTAVE